MWKTILLAKSPLNDYCVHKLNLLFNLFCVSVSNLEFIPTNWTYVPAIYCIVLTALWSLIAHAWHILFFPPRILSSISLSQFPFILKDSTLMSSPLWGLRKSKAFHFWDCISYIINLPYNIYYIVTIISEKIHIDILRELQMELVFELNHFLHLQHV
jgi:hypothetical protein